MTKRLYYNDPYLRSFDATVTSVDRDGERPIVTLDQTAFYPTSGGQPFDTGTLGDARVVDVIDREDGTIAHVVEAGFWGTGDPIHGEIDWSRRFDHMQQHTGQHVLSAAFERLFHVRTVSFHMGADASTIDLARAVSDQEVAAAEAEANRIVWEDRSVDIRYASAEEAAALPLRKESRREGTLRLIDVTGFDLSACGGTHVARTGAIGIIAISGWEKFKGGYRVEFLCGGRALKQFGSWRDITDAATRLLSIGAADLPSVIERMQADAKEQKRALAGLHNELARCRADELAATADNGLIVQPVDADASGLKMLATAITSKPGLTVILFSAQQPALVVVARSADVTDVNAHKLLGALIAKYGGRGGGKPELAQGGGLVNFVIAQIKSEIVELLRTNSV
ncbi:MAG TPA: DHHA1 domain-containing protein [Vicinamibacterales bacterium]|nr:DHHA1 domain-containing protein [Vicinamibacterales bacterium]